LHNDHEGSNVLITDLSGNVIENTFFSPHGEIISGGKASRFDSEGKEFDSLTKLYDFHFRMYNPQRPPFEQPDTLIQNVYDPQLLNRYSFERNNPLKFIDPEGKEPITIGAVLAFVGYAADAFTFSYYSVRAAFESDPIKQREYSAKALITGYLAFNVAPGDATAVAIGGELGFKFISRFKSFKTLFPDAYKIADTYQKLESISDTASIINSAISNNAAYSHVSNNQNINSNIRSEIQTSIINTANSGSNVKWYYNDKTGNYQYWVGSGRPSNSENKEIKSNSGSSNSGGSGGSYCRGTCTKVVDKGIKK